MDQPNDGDRQPPRRDRQPPLKVNKDSHKIRKPPIPPPGPPPPPNPNGPVIIIEVPPEVHHTNPTDFRELVQRLTGPPPAGPTVVLDDNNSNTMIAGTSNNLSQMGGYGQAGLQENLAAGPGLPMFTMPVPDPSPFRSSHHPQNQDYYSNYNYMLQSGASSSLTPNAFISNDQPPSPDSYDLLNSILYPQQQGGLGDDDNQ